MRKKTAFETTDLNSLLLWPLDLFASIPWSLNENIFFSYLRRFVIKITIKIMRYLDAIMMEPYMQTIEMGRLRLNAPFLPNETIRKLLNVNETPLKQPISGIVCDLEVR